MTVFITGGTGHIGSAVVPALVAAGHEVTALARSDASAATLEGLGATPVRGDLGDAAVLRDAAAAAGAAIHLGSPGDETSPQVDRDAAAAMQEGLGPDGVYVHTGGIWVYGTTDGEVDEDAPLAPPALTAWRPEVEGEVLGRGNARLVMPGVVWGNRPGLFELVLDGRYPEGDPRTTAVHADDLADLYVRTLGTPAGTRLLGVTECVRTSAVAKALGGGEATAEAAADLEARLGPLAEAMSLDQQLSSARARALGWAPAHADVVAELTRG